MKKKGLLTFLLIASLGNLKAGEEVKGLEQDPVRITKRSVQENLKPGEAIAEFSFRVATKGYPIIIEYGDKTITINSNIYKHELRLKPGKYKFHFSSEYNRSAHSDSIVIGDREKVEFDIRLRGYNLKKKKPVIYLYPEITKQIFIQLDPEGEMSFTYPLYNNGWSCTADPDGTIHLNDKTYNYLFWEGDGDQGVMINELNKNKGFIIGKDELLAFLENSLTQMGFNSKEQQDFITYWYPQMIKNEKNQICFLFNEDYNRYADLTVSPKPDHMLRMFMIWKKADENIVLNPQIFPEFNRNGFSLVEWGGAEIIETGL